MSTDDTTQDQPSSTPSTDDDTEGHRAIRGNDDTEGHLIREANTDDDVEGHRVIRGNDDADDDTEGHLRAF